MCVLSGPKTTTPAASSFLDVGGERRGKSSYRLTAGLLWFQAFLTGPCSLLVLSLASLFFLPKSLFPPLVCSEVPVGFWNTEIACVLFYLSGTQWEFPLQPTAGSGMSFDSPLKSPLITSLSPLSFFIFSPLPHCLFFLFLSPHCSMFYLFLSTMSPHQCFRGRLLGRG